MNALTIFLFVVAIVTASAIPKNRIRSGLRQKRSNEHIIRECMLVTSDPGHYFYKAIGDDPTVCGVYLMTDPDKIIELQFDYLDLPCSTGGLVAWVDGWELSGGYFPTPEEHKLSLEERITEFCGQTRPSRVFLSSQNAALIQYRVPKRSRGFSFRVNFLKNPTRQDSQVKTETSDLVTETPSTLTISKRDTYGPETRSQGFQKYHPGIIIRTEVTHQGRNPGRCDTQVQNKKRTDKYETDETKMLNYKELERVVLLEQLASTRLIREYYSQLLGKTKREVGPDSGLTVKMFKTRGFDELRLYNVSNITFACNVLVEGMEDVYTIRNYGKATNCSLTSLFPAQISVLSLSVGVSFPGDSFKIETGTMRKCEETGLRDYVEISGGLDLAAPKLARAHTLCGIDSYPDNDWEDYVDALVGDYHGYREEIVYYGPLLETVLCGIATVRLVSSGQYDNSVTVAVHQASEQDLLSPTIICPL